MMETGERAENLARGVIGPLVTGGPIELQRPFGPKLALAIGPERTIVDNDLRTDVDNGRLRMARTVAALDVMPQPGPAEWSMAAAFNDLLQVTNHQLSSFVTRGRHPNLLDTVVELCDAIPLCATLQEAVARHATFARALLVERTDTSISWWTGSNSFRGQPAPQRLLRWREFRNVRVDEKAVPLVDMAAGVPIDPLAYLDAVAKWLACTPITDLATASRTKPDFAWSAHTLSLVSHVAGSNLALRAFARETAYDDDAVNAAVHAMRVAAEQLWEGEQRELAVAFADQLAAADAFWNEEESA